MVDSLDRLEDLLGRLASASIVVGTMRQFTVRWDCGCVATGPTLRALEVGPPTCAVRPQRTV
jgi:hypothetical protein